MDDRITGAILIIIGLPIAFLGGTMSTLVEAIFYAGGFLTAFIGLGFFIKYYKKSSSMNRSED
ncbi:MAG: hypothetical protein ACFFB2_07170 [Promethearchaeota archaeon]